MPKLSIITINLNNGAGLQKTMESVFAQTFKDYEYIIIDGGSTDGSKELIEKHQNKLVYGVSEKDEGVYHAMNKGIRKTRGEYLLFLNSGDIFHSIDSIQILLKDSVEDIIYGNIMVNSTAGNWLKEYPLDLTFEYFLHDTLPHPASIIKKALFDKLGLYNEQNKIVSDWEFYMKAIFLHKASYKYINSILVDFDFEGISSKMENASIIKEEKEIVLKKYYTGFPPENKRVVENNKSIKDNQISRLPKLLNRTFLYKLVKLIKLS